MVEIPIKKISFRKRFRKDHGDIAGLAASIQKQGLLQPIVVVKEKEFFRLLAGRRRLQACQKLGWKKIQALVFETENELFCLEVERDENECRKEYTPSERVAIGEAIEKILGEHRGKPSKDIPQNFGELKGKETAEVAAKKAGFGNPETYRQAKSVVAKGSVELVEAMDKEVVSISDAAAVAKKTPEVQLQAIDSVKEGKTTTAREAVCSEIKPDNPKFDDQIIPSIFGKLVRAIDTRSKTFGKTQGFQDCEQALREFQAAFDRWKSEGEKK